MKKLLLTVIAAFALSGSVFAQEYHYQPNISDYENWDLILTYAQIDGVFIEATDNWADMELASFVGDECRGAIFLVDETDLGDEHPAAQLPVNYTANGEEVTYRMYDHSTGTEYTGTINISYVTGDGDHNEIWFGEDPVIINYTAMTPATQTFTLDITGYTGDGGYYLIASPVEEDITPAATNGFVTGGYDLYYFDQSQDHEWMNYKANNFDIANGKGYLYASNTDTQLEFTGTPYSGDGIVDVTYDAGSTYPGVNLVGNPFPGTAYLAQPFYRLNGAGSEVEPTAASGEIQMFEGVFVQVADGTWTCEFTTTAPTKSPATLNVTVSQYRDKLDKAIINFGDGATLEKFQLNPSHTKVYVPVEGKDYAVANAEGEMGEMPVSFKAERNGAYTLGFNSENATFSYLHLIDNMTGADVDLLAMPSYTFDALTTDYASRFRLVFATGSSLDGDSFGYVNGNGNLSIFGIEGEATVQVIDAVGRVLSSETFSGSYEKKIDAAPGVYMVRLINGNDVKVQKIVVR